MKKLLLVGLFAGLLFSFASTSNQNNTSTNNVDCSDALNRFTEMDLIVGTRMLQAFTNSTTCESGVVSPIAILLNLLALALFAEGATKNEAYNTLGLNSPDEMICVSNTVNNEIKNLPDCIELRPATDFFGNEQYPFTPAFKKVMIDVVVGEAVNLDLADPDALNIINSKVASQTGNRIPNVLTDDTTFDTSSELVSITATFARGDWQIGMQSTDQVTEFRVSSTQSEPQEFLYSTGTYLYGHSDILKAQVVQMNFCIESFYMWEILPDTPFTEDDLIKKMALNTDWYYELKQNMKHTGIELYVPRCNLSTTVDSEDIFGKATEIKTVYDDKTIDLDGVIEGECQGAVTEGVQSVYVTTGFEGGSVSNESQSQEPSTVVKADYPHVWIVFLNDRVHFVGVTRGRIY